MEEHAPAPRLSVIVPATNDPPTLARTLSAIDRATAAGDEVIVVREPPLAGPALARNTGAVRASGDVLVFVDADVEIDDRALTHIRRAFALDPELTALFGSYDDRPAAVGMVSRFRNLLHHHVHHAGAGPASTFWAGLGAVSRPAFVAAGGFDDVRFAVPSVEDIELGMRLSGAGGRIVLDPTIQGTHLKRWTLWSMVRTDFLQRGIPWVRLLLERGTHAGALNLGWRHRLSALVCLGLVATVAMLELTLAGALILTLLALNRSFYALLLRRTGPLGLTAGVVLHAVHHLTAVAALAGGILVVVYTGVRPAVRRSRGARPRQASEYL